MCGSRGVWWLRSIDFKAPSVCSKALVGVEEYYPISTLVFDPREAV